MDQPREYIGKILFISLIVGLFAATVFLTDLLLANHLIYTFVLLWLFVWIYFIVSNTLKRIALFLIDPWPWKIKPIQHSLSSSDEIKTQTPRKIVYTYAIGHLPFGIGSLLILQELLFLTIFSSSTQTILAFIFALDVGFFTLGTILSLVMNYALYGEYQVQQAEIEEF